MTMDQSANLTTPIKVKRPFDVAFLMLPDEKLQQKLAKKELPEEDDEEIEVGTNQDLRAKFFTQKQQIFDDPNLIKAQNLEKLRKSVSSEHQKSAFTKVNLRLSPQSVSPDITYQHSLSPSPPIINRTYQHPPMLSPNPLFKPSNSPYQLLPEAENPFLLKPGQSTFTKMYSRPDLAAYNYQQQFNHQEMLKMASGAPAILSSLLPPSLAALSLPSQNVCAKCNISFRMTSDLVYHMRSHHKNDTMDVHRRRREEKLKCPVCAESFRERHHLTRHMTAHQDKDEDEAGIKKKCVPGVMH